MALVSAPSTPERPVPPVRRAFTAPTKSFHERAFSRGQQSDDGETLFAHEAARIIAFDTSHPLSRRISVVSNESSRSEAASGTLPWASHTERTIATGPLRIYRVLGSVAFLNSGSILQPLLGKSQCWCVDGVSKFALRIRENSFYRIELPYLTDSDKAHVDDFKVILEKVLQYEKTQCPFKRSFTVELPEPPETPIKLVPWRPKPSPSENLTPEDDGVKIVAPFPKKLGVQRSSKLSPSRSDDSDPTTPEKVADFPSSSSDISSLSESPCRDRHYAISNRAETLPNPDTPSDQVALSVVRKRPTTIDRIQTLPDSFPRVHRVSTSSLTVPRLAHGDSMGFSSSMESFHSVSGADSSSSSSLSPVDYESVPSREPSNDSDEMRPSIAVDGPGSPLWDLSNTSPIASAIAPPSSNTDQDVHRTTSITEEVKNVRLQRTLSKRRTVSPLPSSVNLCSPYSPTRSVSGPRFTNAMLQRSCALLIGPPLRLMALMIRIAARIIRGTMQGKALGYGESGEKIPCTWDFSSDGSEDDDLSDEDDFGVKLGKTVSGREVRCDDSWEID